VRPYLRNIAFVGKALDGQFASTGFSVIRPADGICGRYLFNLVNWGAFVSAVLPFQRGSSYPAVLDEDVKAIEVLIPPSAEQERIGAAIDALFTRLDEAEQGLTNGKRLSQQYRRSIVRAAYCGRLTDEIRERLDKLDTSETLVRKLLAARASITNGRKAAGHDTRGNNDSGLRPALDCPKTWSWTTLGEIAEVVGGITKDAKRKPENGAQVPYLRVANVQRGYLDLSEIKYILAAPNELEQLKLRSGDILLNEGGDLDKLGRGWVWSGQIDPCIHQNHVFRARIFVREVPSTYISRYINEFCQPFFVSQGTQTTNLASVSMSKIRRLPIPIPSLNEMIEIDRRCTDLMTSINEVESTIEERRASIARLRQAILARAFHGELVPQDPNDGPAEKLLERIRSREMSTNDGRRKAKVTA
jgi:type I restriction enzyme S subunit